MVITSRENKIFKLALKLKEKRGREESGLFMIEGLRSVRDAYQKGAKFEYVFSTENKSPEESFGCDVTEFAPRLFREISDTVNSQGIIGVCKIPSCSFKDILNRKNGSVLICESLQDPGNIGTIIRTAHAAGSDGVVLTKGCCDLYNPKIVRATMSAIFSVPIVTGVSSKEALAYFKKNGYKIAAGALTEKSENIFSADLSGKFAFIIGNEANGVKEETLALCDGILKIPMEADAESLNASVAGGIMVYEHFRQRFSEPIR